MEIINMPIGEIVPYDKNAKKHPETQVEHIANSIKEFGFRQPLVVDRNNVLVIGHGRLLAAKKLGMSSVPVVRADDLTDEQIKALRLADNKTNESEWDLDLLDVELENILNINMEDFGFYKPEEEDPKEEKEMDPAEILPDSRVIVAGVSVFGTSSECFVNTVIDPEEAEKLLAKIQEMSPEYTAQKILEALRDL